MLKRYPVKVKTPEGEKIYSAKFQTSPEYARAWRRVLEKCYKKAVLYCCCPGKGEKKLYIRYVSDTDTYIVARYPGTGKNHARDCIYYQAESSSGAITRSEREKLVEETSDGLIRVKTVIGIRKRDTVPKRLETEKKPKPRNSGLRVVRRKPAISLLNLVYLLWEKAGLNRWHPNMEGKRKISTVYTLLDNAAKRVMAGREILSKVLLFGTQNRFQENLNREKLEYAEKNNRRLIILGLFEGVKENRIFLKYGSSLPEIKIDDSLWKKTEEEFGVVLKSGCSVLAAIQTDPPVHGKNGRYFTMAKDIALMPVSENWVVVNSVYELMVAEKLIREGRIFKKPLLRENQKVFPDFVLLDSHIKIMKVFDTVEKRKEEFRLCHTRYGSNWWYWDVMKNPDRIPPLPPRTYGKRQEE